MSAEIEQVVAMRAIAEFYVQGDVEVLNPERRRPTVGESLITNAPPEVSTLVAQYSLFL